LQAGRRQRDPGWFRSGSTGKREVFERRVCADAVEIWLDRSVMEALVSRAASDGPTVTVVRWHLAYGSLNQ
jgi:hypothetical protein